jgi:CubicO group peptidase (beta-lactamase class C family)
MGALPAERLVRVILPPGTEQTSWNWNSPYWRGLGSPWGGLHTTAGDYARVLDMMLDGGRFGQTQIVSAAMTSAMLTNQLLGMPALSARAQRENGWGLGWRLNQPPGTHGLPEIAPVCTFGHGGATGTVAWGDPDSGLACVILTNDPQSGDFRARASNLVAGMAT